LALGGGAFMDPGTRAKLKEQALTIWLRAELDTLVARTARKRGTRPLLAQGDPREILGRLMDQRHPVYAEADHVVDTGEQPAEVVVGRIVDLLRAAAPPGAAQ
jgi:shikimate kinase